VSRVPYDLKDFSDEGALKEYFENINIEDLRDLDEYDFMMAVEPKHKLLMKLFLSGVLSKYFKTTASFEEILPTIERNEVGLLDYRGKLISSCFGNLKSHKKTPEELLQIEFKDQKEIKRIDFSQNNLFDSDLPVIEKIIKMFPSCECVNLSFNRFHGIQNNQDQAILEILECSNVHFVDISMNALASTDRTDFFKALEKKHFKKLIWIPKNWLNGENWKKLAFGYVDTVKSAHVEYYQTVTW